jgi:hypothetical protein
VTGSRQFTFSSARRAPRRRWWRAAGLTLGLVTALILLVALLAGSLYAYAWVRLGGDPLLAAGEELEAVGAAASSPQGATTVLVAITAERDVTDPTPPELRGPLLLVQAGGPREVPAVLLLPEPLPIGRDGDPTATAADVQAAGDLVGVVSSVRDYTGVDLDHAVAVSEDALPRLVALQQPERCDDGTCRPVDPDEARPDLQGDPDAQVAAAAAVLRSLAGQLDPLGAMTSPVSTKRTIDVLADDVQTDVSLRGGGLLDVARTFEDAPDPEVAVVPLLQRPDGGEVVLLEPAETLFQRLREGQPLDGADLQVDDPSALVGEVPVAILNGAGIDGLAGQVEATLSTAGFRIVGTGNAARFGDGATLISYAPDDQLAEATAILLAERLAGATLQESERTPSFEGDPVSVVVTVGPDLHEDG